MLRTGVPNTTITNTIVAAAAFVSGCLKGGGIPGEDFCYMGKGDDSIAFCKPALRPFIEQSYKDFGLILKSKWAHPQHEHSFCSNRFYPVRMSDGTIQYRPGPTIKVLRGLFVTYSDVPLRGYRSYILGVALGLRKVCNKVPILHEVLEHIISKKMGKYDKYFKLAQGELDVKLIKSFSKTSEINEMSYQHMSNQLQLPVPILQKARDAWIRAIDIAFENRNSAGYVFDPHLDLLTEAIDKHFLT